MKSLNTFYNLTSKLTIAFSLVLMPVWAATKSGTNEVSGTVYDKLNNEPVIYALVALGSSKDSSIVMTTYTDSSGNYQLRNVKNGDYFVLAQMIGYDKVTESLKIDSIQNQARKDFKLEVSQSKEIKVVAKRPYIESKSDRIVLNTDAQLSAVGESVFENLKKAPGVYIDKDENINLRGKQGVLIMVNDKPTYLSGTQLTNYLKGIQLTEVEKIEIIINPPAKYDAAGNSGIINIKLKKNTKIGLNGTFNTSAWVGDNLNGNMGANLNYRKGKVNVFANIYPGDYKGLNSMELKRYITLNDTTMTLSQKSRAEWNYKAFGYTTGVDYEIDNCQTIGFMTRGGNNSFTDSRVSSIDFINNLQAPDSSLSAISSNDGQFNNYSFNLNYKLTIDTTGREFSTDIDYAMYKNTNGNKMNTNYFDQNNNKLRNTSILSGQTPVNVDINSIKCDYIHPYKGYRFESGAKASMVKTDNDISYKKFNYITNNDIIDPTRSNHFKYIESILAGYIAVSKELGKFSLKAGLRVEKTISDGNSLTLKQHNERSYTDLFPSVFIQRKLNDNHTIGLNYNRRIDRPDYESLNPFVYYIDEYTYQKGNAYLNPQYTNSFTLNHNYKNALFTSISYNRTSQPQIDLIRQNDTTKVGYQVRENLDLMENLNLNIGFNIPVTNWYRINANTNTYYNTFVSNKGFDKINNNILSFNAWSGHYFTLPKNYVMEVTTWYQAPSTYGIFELSGHYNIGMGIQKQILKDRGQIKLFVRDIFDTSKENAKIDRPEMKITNYNKWDSRQFGFSFSYRFGSDDIKPSRDRKTGMDDEQNRVKSGKS